MIAEVCREGEEWDLMIKISEAVERLIKDYGREACFNHREEIYAAIKAVCLCAEFLQNQEDWGSKRAIPLRGGWMEDDWEKSCWENYHPGLREEELWKLREELDNQESWMGKEIPIKNFLSQGIRFMIHITHMPLHSDIAAKQWMGLMEMQIITDHYTGFQAFQEAVYVFGLFELIKFHYGVNFHYFEGDFYDAAYLLFAFRSLIPEEEQENYDRYCEALLKEIEEKRMDTINRLLKEREELLEKTKKAKGGIPILDLFQKKMKEMKENEFETFVGRQLEEYDEDWGVSKEQLTSWETPVPEYLAMWKPQLNIREGIKKRVWNVAELFIYGDNSLKKRVLNYLLWEEQKIVMEYWVGEFYPSSVGELAERMSHMYKTAKLGSFCQEAVSLSGWESLYQKIMGDSLERILGRSVREKEIPDYYESTEFSL